MAIRTTPLGFKKPDGRELINRMDDHISENAQKAQDLFSQVLPDVAALKALGGLAPGDVSDAVTAALVGNPETDTGAAVGDRLATEIQTPGTPANTALSATTAKSVPFASSLSAKVPVFAPRLAGVPSASVDTLTLLPATTQSQGRLLRPYEPAPRSARYLNVGVNPFRVAYANGTRYNFSSPTVPYPAGNEVLPGEEWVETNENRPLWIMSTLGTTVTYEVQIGADLA